VLTYSHALFFELGFNNLNGILPSELGNLRRLRGLDLGKCLKLVFHGICWCSLVFVVLQSEEGFNCKNEKESDVVLTHTLFFLISMYYLVIQFR